MRFDVHFRTITQQPQDCADLGGFNQPLTNGRTLEPRSQTVRRHRGGVVSSALEAGTVWVNCFFGRELSAPFGGSGRSGIGRESGIWSFDFYSDTKKTAFSPNG